jgi:hypothetical protein
MHDFLIKTENTLNKTVRISLKDSHGVKHLPDSTRVMMDPQDKVMRVSHTVKLSGDAGFNMVKRDKFKPYAEALTALNSGGRDLFLRESSSPKRESRLVFMNAVTERASDGKLKEMMKANRMLKNNTSIAAMPNLESLDR